MLLEIACIVAGFLGGMTYAQERDWQGYRKTRREVEEEIGKEFDYYKNLSESLKQDIHELKTRKK
ncbi:MAG: hypothetical protein EBU08_05365 [Micrococcales bacterium]|jgi:hypothetical protein|nr:hypothetical protein [Micrococcales bacterium]